jgi:hypothetical protein
VTELPSTKATRPSPESEKPVTACLASILLRDGHDGTDGVVIVAKKRFLLLPLTGHTKRPFWPKTTVSRDEKVVDRLVLSIDPAKVQSVIPTFNSTVLANSV